MGLKTANALVALVLEFAKSKFYFCSASLRKKVASLISLKKISFFMKKSNFIEQTYNWQNETHLGFKVLTLFFCVLRSYENSSAILQQM